MIWDVTKNLAKNMNSILKRARCLFICALVKTTFERKNIDLLNEGTRLSARYKQGIDILKILLSY